MAAHTRNGSILILIALLALLDPHSALPQTTPPSLLLNGGFENGAAGWTKFGNVEIAEWAKQTGVSGAAMQGWIWSGKGGLFQSVQGSPGLTYTLSVSAKKEPLFEAAKVYISLEFYTTDNATKAGHDQGTLNVSTLLTTDWQTFTISGTAPLGTVYVRPVIRFEDSTKGDLGGGKQSCLWDNAILTVSGP